MKVSIRLISLFCLVLVYQICDGQVIPRGKYVGYESIWVSKGAVSYFFPGIYTKKQTDTTASFGHSNKWFHEVTIDFTADSCIKITKVPIYFMGGIKHYSDSLGGFLTYGCSKTMYYSRQAPENKRGKKFIFGSLTTGKYLKGAGSGVPRYKYVKYDVESVSDGEIRLRTEFGVLEYKRKED
ncbi:hypothetical protein GU926_17630 [Nibribacter ruber]|uniref:Uncharacterized protein n=1 Tax=Nibribacter ruber TaxID=2698458 RepID=A0A6P1P441_9BACT|nr:hypothetical protein [Nibribacter ruber]QHL89153.1 hypothetical protein GU926_17630 [Nibribacter ruber]